MQKNQAEDAVVKEETVKKAALSLDQLANEFVNYELPREILEVFKATGRTPFGTLAFTKLVFFIQENQIKNDAVNYYASLSPARNDDEDYQSYRNRRKFNQTLNKYRSAIYNYPPGSGQGYMFKWEK